MKNNDCTSISTDKIAEKIQQRRLQILIHSYIYYILDDNIISDTKWNNWATELVSLQRKYPEIASSVIYNDMFSDWQGSTGADFEYNDYIVNKANYLLAIHKDIAHFEKDVVNKNISKNKMSQPKRRCLF